MKHRSWLRFVLVFLFLFATLPYYSDAAHAEKAFSTLKVGETVSLGTYGQDNNKKNGAEPIMWTVLTIQDGEALLLSKYVLDNLQYNNKKGDITYLYSSIRKWLNSDFIETAFPGELQDYRVFLLSYKEANDYLKEKKVSATEYASGKGADEWFTDYCSWWLRSPGRVQYDGCYISSDGDFGSSSAKDKRGIRPAIWVHMASSNTANGSSSSTSDTSTASNTTSSLTIETLEAINGPEIKRGSKGEIVKGIQQILIELGYLAPGGADGDFGKKTEAAVIEFQNSIGLKPTGIANVATQYKLAEAVSGFSKPSGKSYEYAGIDFYGVACFQSAFYVGLIKEGSQYQEGTYYHMEGTTYFGTFKDNKRSGTGQCWYPNGDYYSGGWENDVMNGHGTYHFGSVNSVECYEGEWEKGKMSGKGV